MLCGVLVFAVAMGIPFYLIMTDTQVEGYDVALVEMYAPVTTKYSIYTSIETENVRQGEVADGLQLAGAWDGNYPDVSLDIFRDWPHGSAAGTEQKKITIAAMLPVVMAIHKTEPKLYPSYLITLFLNESGWGYTGAYGHCRGYLHTVRR
jgi:hypothetical protein